MESRLYIDGQWTDALTGKTDELFCPSTGKKIADISSAGKEDVELAAAAARRAMQQGSEWTTMTDAERAQLLRKAADKIEQRSEEFGLCESMCNGRHLRETRYEGAAAAEIFRYYAGLIGQTTACSYVTDGPFTSMSMLEPVGVVGAIVAWNYPMMIAASIMAPALAAGNAIVLKPSSVTPLTAILYFEIFHEVGFPKGAVNLILGKGETGSYLAKNKDIDMISFVGGTETGKKIMQYASENVKRMSLELGGKSAVVVFDDCDIEAAVENVLQGIFTSSGQVCTAGSRLYVQRGIYKEFLARLEAGACSIRVGRYDKEDAHIGGLSSVRHMESVLAAIERGLSEGAKLLCGGHRITTGELADGCFVEPTVFVDVTPDMFVSREEIFGPVLTVTPFDSDDEGIAMANDSSYGLAGYAFTTSLKRALRAARELQAGNININANFAFGCQHGGGEPYKQSGMGIGGGAQAVRSYMKQKMVNINWRAQVNGFLSL